MGSPALVVIPGFANGQDSPQRDVGGALLQGVSSFIK